MAIERSLYSSEEINSNHKHREHTQNKCIFYANYRIASGCIAHKLWLYVRFINASACVVHLCTRRIYTYVVWKMGAERGQQDSLIKLFRWMVFCCCCCTSKSTWIGSVVLVVFPSAPRYPLYFIIFNTLFLIRSAPPAHTTTSGPAHPLPRSIKTLSFIDNDFFIHSSETIIIFKETNKKEAAAQKSLSRWNSKHPQSYIDFILVTPFSPWLWLSYYSS